MTPVVSIIIPTYNHGAYVRDAIESCLAQTVWCEVIVVDDGSTDGTSEILEEYLDVRLIQLPHGGPSLARNAGLDAASGEFVMLLDADDVIAPAKVEKQLAAFTDDIGWVLCDVRIEDAGRGSTELASARYDYTRKQLGGWIAPLLEPANFIPIMSPLVRRSVLNGIRFADTPDGTPEDWRFWQKVAAVARCRYIPEVLATYRKRKDGRNRLPKSARAVVPNIEHPLRLNLGCGTPGTRSWHPIKGFVNLDKSMGWQFEDGLPDFADGSVAAITISHALMYLAEAHWPAFLSECARVLADGGVLRITEDETADPRSSRLGGWRGSEPAVTLTTPAFVLEQLARAGFEGHPVNVDTTKYADRSLCQAQHGEAPHVFFVEGVKICGVLFAPHNDDEALFAAFTILRHRPHVVICYGSTGDYGDSKKREDETRDAMRVLGARSVTQWSGGPVVESMRDLDARIHPARIWAPNADSSHPDHVAVAEAAAQVFGRRLQTTYHTYRDGEKVRRGTPVPVEPVWVAQKLRALSRYESQIAHPRAHRFFMNDLHEFVEGTV